MSNDPVDRSKSSRNDPAYRHREIAESFGPIADDYDRARPRYPFAVVHAIAERLPGKRVLDVGIGTGISAEPFRDRGFHVLGLEPDEEMAERARAKGFTVAIGRFEDWDSRGRAFDGIIAGQSWHWVDPDRGGQRAAELLRPGGTLALFWNTSSPDRELSERFAAAFSALDLGLPFNPWAVAPDAGAESDPYGAIIAAAGAGLAATGAFGPVERLEFRWSATARRDEWLATTTTSGGINRLPGAQLERLLTALGREIDAVGGSLHVNYAAVAAIATRTTA